VGYSSTWKILEEIIIEFRKKSLAVPESVMNDLKSAKTMIKLMEAEQDRGEIGPKVEQYLSSVEAYLVTEAQKAFPPERIDEWLRRLQNSSCDVCAAQPKPSTKESRFITGLPRDQKWVRVTPIASLPTKKLVQLGEETNLSHKTEQDEHIIFYGRAEDIKEFVKKMTKHTSQ
jgi:hypothetical protein